MAERRRRTQCRGPAVVGACALALLLAAPAHAIVGGAAAPEGRWPWMAALLDSGESDAGWAQFCGGAVIAPRRVLTAAHCVIDQDRDDVDVLVGRTRLSTHAGRRIAVKAISVFPGYADDDTPSLDAAVLELREDARVPPLALARPGQEAAWAAGTMAWTLGWGQINAGRSPAGFRYYADRLRELQEPLQGDDACEGVFGLGFPRLPYRPEWLLCAGAAGDHAGSCYGDSGGPLVVGRPEGWLDVGIDVAGDACATPAYFDLNVRVDRISSFALSRTLAAQPSLVAAPRIRGRLRRGARVRCTTGRWRGSPTSFTWRWRRLGSRHVVGHGRSHRVGRRDAASGLACSVTASSRGGRLTVTTRRRGKRSRSA
jgi:hypothetical protein